MQQSSTYKAAVVEFAPTWDPNNESTNAKRYADIIKSDEVKEVEIIVFPEDALIREFEPIAVPRTEDKVIPCENDKYSDILKIISCAAKEARKYVVVQLYMKRNCKEDRAFNPDDSRPCTKEDIIYNTAVAFDRDGTVIAV